MAGEAQYINPIIQAIIQGNQLALQNRSLSAQVANQQVQREQAQNELKIRQQLADQAEENIQRQHEYNQGMLENEHNRLQAQLQEHNLNATLAIPTLIKAGLPNELIASLLGGKMTGSPGQNAPDNPMASAPGFPTPQATPDTRAIQLPNGGPNIPLSAFPTQQSELESEMQRAQGLSGATETGRLKAQEPFEIADEARKASTARDLKKMELDAQAKRDQFDKQTQVQVANIRNQPEFQRNQLQYAITPEVMQSGIRGFMNGDFLPSNQDMTNPKMATIYSAFKQLGGQSNSKQTQEFFGNSNRVDEAVNDLKTVANSLPDETKLGRGGAVANARALSMIANSSLSTDIKNKIQELNLNIPAILKSVQQVPGSRLNTMDQMVVQKGLDNIGTKQQALDYANHLLQMRDSNIVNAQSMMPQLQQNILFKDKGVKPSWIIQAENTPQAQSQKANGFTIDLPKSVNKNQLVWDSPQ
jgi:hypothetical protein